MPSEILLLYTYKFAHFGSCDDFSASVGLLDTLGLSLLFDRCLLLIAILIFNIGVEVSITSKHLQILQLVLVAVQFLDESAGGAALVCRGAFVGFVFQRTLSLLH